MYKIKITLDNGYYYIKTMTEDEVKDFKNSLRYIDLIELSVNRTDEVIILRDSINSIEIENLEREINKRRNKNE